jgi:hypothetical protein
MVAVWPRDARGALRASPTESLVPATSCPGCRLSARDVVLQVDQLLAVLLPAPLLQGVIQRFEERVDGEVCLHPSESARRRDDPIGRKFSVRSVPLWYGGVSQDIRRAATTALKQNANQAKIRNRDVPSQSVGGGANR